MKGRADHMWWKLICCHLKGFAQLRRDKVQQRLRESVPTEFLTCNINYEPAILLLLLLNKGFGLLQAFWRFAVTEEEAGETLKHGGKLSSGMDSELELLLGTGFQAEMRAMAREGKNQPLRSQGRWRCSAASESAAEFSDV